MARLTIERSVMGKIRTQAQKPVNVHITRLLAGVKITENERHDSILWDPAPELIAALIKLLENEIGFIRKKDSAPAQRLHENLRKIKLFVGSAEV